MLFDIFRRGSDRRLVRRLSSVQTLYKRSKQILTTRSCEIVEALSVRDNRRVVLWCLRFPLSSGSKSEEVFTRRISKILRQPVRLPEFVAYGLDLEGTAFAAAESFEFHDIIGPRYDEEELKAIFYDLVRQTACLHKANIVLGDIGAHTFTFDSAGRVRLANVLGPLPPQENGKSNWIDEHGYVSPEERRGEACTAASDVYSLGILLFQLATRHSFIQAQSEDKHRDYLTRNLSDLLAAYSPAPACINKVLQQCLAWNPEQRPADAVELLDRLSAVVGYRERMGYRNRRMGVKTADLTPSEKFQETWDRLLNFDFAFAKYMVHGIIFAAVAAALVLFIFAFGRYQQQNPPPPASPALAGAKEALPENLKLAQANSASWRDIKKMMKTAEKPEAKSENEATWDLLFKHTKYSNPNAANVPAGLPARPQQPAAPPPPALTQPASAPPAPSPAASALTPTAVGQASAQVQTALSPAHDQPLPHTQTPAQIQAAQVQAPGNIQTPPRISAQQPAAGRSPLAHADSVLGGKGTARHGLPLAFQRLGSYKPLPAATSSGEERNALLDVNSTSDERARAAREAISQEKFSPEHRIFLQILIRSLDMGWLAPEAEQALAQAAGVGPDFLNVERFGAWNSPYAEYALLAACAAAQSRVTLDRAFNLLSARPLKSGRARSFISRIKRKEWNRRLSLARAVCRASLVEMLPEPMVSEAVYILLPHMGEAVSMSTNEHAAARDESPWCPSGRVR